MKKETHYKIVRGMKTALFILFLANVARILWRTWKLGGSKSTYEVKFVDDVTDELGDLTDDEIEEYLSQHYPVIEKVYNG